MESKVKRENYILISGWMVTDLHLKGNELIVFAMIYGFSQDGVGTFNGSRQYIADWINGSKQTVQNILNSLVLKGYINKKDKMINNVKYCEYSVSERCMGWSKNLTGVGKNFDWGVDKKFDWGGQKICPNNKDIININNKNNNIPASAGSASDDFEKLWSLYPNKKGKTEALKSYQKAVKKGVTNDVIEKGIRALIADIKKNHTDKRYIPHGSTWFNQERWNDEYGSSNNADYEGGENILDELEGFI